MDGGTTRVDWCPDLLVLRREDLRSHREVLAAPGPGSAYYEEVSYMMDRLHQAADIDPEDIENARLIMASGESLVVVGPNQIDDHECDVQFLKQTQ